MGDVAALRACDQEGRRGGTFVEKAELVPDTEWLRNAPQVVLDDRRFTRKVLINGLFGRLRFAGESLDTRDVDASRSVTAATASIGNRASGWVANKAKYTDRFTSGTQTCSVAHHQVHQLVYEEWRWRIIGVPAGEDPWPAHPEKSCEVRRVCRAAHLMCHRLWTVLFDMPMCSNSLWGQSSGLNSDVLSSRRPCLLRPQPSPLAVSRDCGHGISAGDRTPSRWQRLRSRPSGARSSLHGGGAFLRLQADYCSNPPDHPSTMREEDMPSVLVTGAGRGIGLAVTERMSR